mmetsp:Transcript_8092/g.23210  ORF Transcript_8092/g.23210 Transcript_8092/m.23210 type:complete len:423 (+) Transcript_8092:153-1421(+)|eukprot:CAMPEP_0117670844 /NCGR_PEP_ID=MMETSP0804-20121206/12997_1 /TAXON_ID=1074897 /ORGANISM="Tetraselmis astigmatica, Strain CCMP880" /LENGTH=422 /DNA_ID=CAMNT_0005479225 /DNA_START=111 /DNA_END=1379 /DNA_ORIENTATION=-
MTNKTQIRSYRAWAPEEEQALRTGVEVHGVGAWQAIRSDPRFSVLEGRRSIQLKDKWRNLVQVSRVSVTEEADTKENLTRACSPDYQGACEAHTDSHTIGRPLITLSSWESEQIAADLHKQTRNGMEPYDANQPFSCKSTEPCSDSQSQATTSSATDDTCAQESDFAETSGLHNAVSALLQPHGSQSSCGLAEFTLRSLHGLADAVINQQKEHAEQMRSKHYRASESSVAPKSEAETLSDYDHELLNAMEFALEAHDVQHEANRQLGILVQASTCGLPGFQSWMRNAVHVAKLANEKAAYAWWRLQSLQNTAAEEDDGQEAGIPLEEAEHNGCLTTSIKEDEDEAIEALSFLQSGVLLQPHGQQQMLQTIETEKQQPLDFTQCEEELQRWAAVVKSMSRRRWKRRAPTGHKPSAKKPKTGRS